LLTVPELRALSTSQIIARLTGEESVEVLRAIQDEIRTRLRPDPDDTSAVDRFPAPERVRLAELGEMVARFLARRRSDV